MEWQPAEQKYNNNYYNYETSAPTAGESESIQWHYNTIIVQTNVQMYP